MKAFPKIYALGSRFTHGIFDGPVEITEKIDGSQFGFGRDLDGTLHCRSKRKPIDIDNPDKMFEMAVQTVALIQHRIPKGMWFWGEYLQKPKHNVLSYDRIPKNHIALFGALDLSDDHIIDEYNTLAIWAQRFKFDIVPLLFQGTIDTPEPITVINELLGIESFLGGPTIEGIVIKRYIDYEVAGVVQPLQSAKYVSGAFKERHTTDWKKSHTNKGKIETLIDSFRHDHARWHKAIACLYELGRLERDPRDIGNLIKIIQSDLKDEETDEIKGALFSIFWPQISRVCIAGFPEWYKEWLVKESTEVSSS